MDRLSVVFSCSHILPFRKKCQVSQRILSPPPSPEACGWLKKDNALDSRASVFTLHAIITIFNKHGSTLLGVKKGWFGFVSHVSGAQLRGEEQVNVITFWKWWYLIIKAVETFISKTKLQNVINRNKKNICHHHIRLLTEAAN